ncbi:MAG TPA: membrane-bound lytic murein transglycosylase MltF [Gammaproteobacteria bacterium]|nr:membrane-bound lytic murein transglycosylase MltF [Gammaproteobacteria bacterium]
MGILTYINGDHRNRLLMLGAAVIAALALAAFGLRAWGSDTTLLDEIRASGKLRVYTREGATTYSVGPHGPEGLEYELLERFARHLGVELEIETHASLQDILDGVAEGRAHLAAAGLTVTEARQHRVRFAPPYQYITEQLVYRRGPNRRPADLLSATRDGDLEVVAHSSHAELLAQLKAEHPELNWDEVEEIDTLELLNLVAEGIIDYTIVDSNELTLHRRFYPHLGVAFDVSKPKPLAWAFARGKDDSLYQEATRFFNELEKTGQLALIVKGFYSHVRAYDYAGTHTFIGHVKRRLPRYRVLLERAALKYDLDWRLLAAVAYQESHWNPHAVSPTGVRGFMMLTQATASQLGVTRRTDPEQSIEGGARYLRSLIDKIPGHIDEADRIWLALAAYNVGYGHLQDARVITRWRNGDPDSWQSIKENLPLLRKRKWYKKTRHGYARGNEPVRYVENIRSYYDILSWYLANDPAEHRNRPVFAIASPVL